MLCAYIVEKYQSPQVLNITNGEIQWQGSNEWLVFDEYIEKHIEIGIIINKTWKMYNSGHQIKNIKKESHEHANLGITSVCKFLAHFLSLDSQDHHFVVLDLCMCGDVI
jgi:hypothetical protein